MYEKSTIRNSSENNLANGNICKHAQCIRTFLSMEKNKIILFEKSILRSGYVTSVLPRALDNVQKQG
jgi:hypothetical protein